MEKRIKFGKRKQKEFIKKVLENSQCPSLRALRQFGFDISYNTLKSYFNENRTLPEELFNQLCFFGRIDSKKLTFDLIDENWGQVKGGKK